MKQYILVADDGMLITDVPIGPEPECDLKSVPLLMHEITLESGETVQVPVLDENGNTIPDPHYIETPCPGGFYWPKWDGTQWIEGGTAPEPVKPEPTAQEIINAQLMLEIAKLKAGVS